MKILIKYPRTPSELNRLMNLLNQKLQDLKTDNRKNNSRSWMRLYQISNDILQEAKDKIKNLGNQPNTFYLIDTHHLKVANIIEEWMRVNKFPIQNKG